jgi:general secretion pathway protein H
MIWRIDTVQNLLPLPLREGVGGRGSAARDFASVLATTPPPNPLPQGEGEKKHGAAGFTLIELMVVLVIMGLMLGLVLRNGPMRSPVLQTRAAAAQVAQGLRSARARAIALNHPVTFSLDVEDHSFRVDDAAPQMLPATLQLAALTVAGKASRQRNDSNISFAPDGSSSGGRIELAGNGVRLLVGVDWLTGLVSVADAR